MSEVGIIGGGVAGCATAIELAEKGYRVHLFESTNALLSQSSDATSNCFGTGFYYTDKQASILSLESCVLLIRYLRDKFGNDFFIRNTDGKSNRITYVNTTQSAIPSAEIFANFEAIKHAYQQLIKQDKDNAVLGPADDLYHVVDKHDFASILDVDTIDLVIDTCDPMFDWPALKAKFISLLAEFNVVVHLNSEVSDIMPIVVKHNKFYTRIKLSNRAIYDFDYVVNAAWRNADQLNQTAGFSIGAPTNNLLCALVVTSVPEILKNKSFFFGYYNHLFFTSDVHGRGYLTCSAQSILGDLDSIKDKEKEDGLFAKLLEKGENLTLGRDIIKAATQHIPVLGDASVLDLKLGVIRRSIPSINTADEKIHYRGVRELSLGLLVNEARQHTFWYQNALETRKAIKKQDKMKSVVLESSQHILSFLPEVLHTKIVFSTLVIHLANAASVQKNHHSLPPF